MNTALDTKLLPCPFCGGDAAIRSNDDSGNAWAECTACMAQAGGYQEQDMPIHILLDHAAKEWNRRLPPSQGEGAPAPDVVERTSNPGERREIQFHLDRLNAWLTELWAANNLTLHMCNGTVRTGLHGLLCDIRDDVMAVRAALTAALAAEPGEAMVDDPVSFQWRTIDGWVEASIGGTIGQRRDYAKQMAANCGLGYRELYAHPAHPLPLKEEVERVARAIVENPPAERQEDTPDGWRIIRDYERTARAAIEAMRAGAQEGWRPTHRHKKRGTEYVLIGIGKMQTENWCDLDEYGDAFGIDMREVAICRSTHDGSLWVRPREEFEDGRFEATAPSPEEGGRS